MSIITIEGGVCAPKGFVAGGVHCGVRKNKIKKDLALIASKTACSAAAMYTTNKVCAAPVNVTRENLSNGRAQAIVCNSGNANACTADGAEKAALMCKLAGEALNIDPSDVIVASTGVIGLTLDIEPIANGVAMLAPMLDENGGESAAEAIMTTDVKLKQIAVEFELGGKKAAMGAIAKGSGMIHPNMATMLCFITTDAAISPQMLSSALHEVVPDTFNMVSVDGDTSTNDMAAILANGCAGNNVIESKNDDYAAFRDALMIVLTDIARKMAADGEGASKLIECVVKGAPDKATAKSTAKSVICSSLVKAAIFGSDANWGRILCAIGYAPGEFNVKLVDVALSSKAGRVPVCKDGAGIEFSEELAKRVLNEAEITIEVDMKQGDGASTAWGCDLTYDYVRINGDYRT